MSRSKGRLTLPDNPSLEQLREQAKERLAIIRSHAPDAQLSDAQFALARDYGFAGWRALKAEVDRRAGALNGLVGHYAYDEALVANSALSVSIRGKNLRLEQRGGVIIEIIPQPDGAFMAPGLTNRYRFERDAAGQAFALLTETETGATVRAPRIDAEKAAQMRAARDLGAKKPWRNRASIVVRAEVLDRYVGAYANSFGGVLTFSREAGKLFLEINRTQVSLFAETETDFFVDAARMEMHFRIDGDVAASVTVRHLGMASTLSRVPAQKVASLHALVARRAAEQAQPRQLAAPVAPDILTRYAGRYRIESGMDMLIEVEGGRIFSQMQGSAVTQPRLEIFPESDRKFFWTARAAQISFFIDTDGNVDYGVFHQSGHLVPMSRIAQTPERISPAA